MRMLAVLLLTASPLAAEAVSQAAPIRAGTPTAGAYEPITSAQRRDFYWRTNFAGPGAFFRSFGQAVGAQAGDDPPEWGQGADAYGKRVASAFGESTIQRSFESGLAAVLKQDPRYIRKASGGFWKRFGHALSSQLLTYNADGRRVFAPARVGGHYAGSMSELLWLPDRYSWKDGVRGGTQSLAVNGVINLIREFGPDIKRAFGGKKQRP